MGMKHSEATKEKKIIHLKATIDKITDNNHVSKSVPTAVRSAPPQGHNEPWGGCEATGEGGNNL